MRPILSLIAIAPLFAQAPPLASTQRLIVDNADVRITELNMDPGQSEPEHKHLRGVTVALSEYDNQIIALPARTVTNRSTPLGEVRWADASHHETKNTGAKPQRVIRVEIKRDTPATPSPAGPLDSVVTAKATQRVLLENADVRVIEELVPPGIAQPKHSHRKSVMVPLANADIEVATYDATDKAGPATKRQVQFAAVSWQAPSVHEVKNVGQTTMRNIRIELK